MKIAIWHNLPSGGGKRALYDHVVGLKARGHTIEVWCPPDADGAYLPLKEIVTEHIVPANVTFKPANIIERFLDPYSAYRKRIADMEKHCETCAEQIRAGNFDLLFAGTCRYFAASPIAQYVKLPSCLYLQEPHRPLYEAMPTNPWMASLQQAQSKWSLRGLKWAAKDQVYIMAQRIRVRAEYQNLKRFDLVLVNSLFSRESVLRCHGIDSKVCYLGINTEKFRPVDSARRKLVLGLGTLGFTKGPDRAIRAVGAIPASMRPEIVWVSNTVYQPYLAEMRQLAAQLEVRFTCKEQASDATLLELLNSASVMIYTSRLEPFGFAPLEANSCGLPVVAIAEGGIRETVLHNVNGLLIDGDDPAKLGAAVSSVLENADLRRKLGQNARQVVLDRWSLPKSIDRLETNLNALLEQRQFECAVVQRRDSVSEHATRQ